MANDTLHRREESSGIEAHDGAGKLFCGQVERRVLAALGDSARQVVGGNLWVSAFTGTKLHLYGKRAARPGRKMGHVTCLGATAAEALALAMTIRAELTPADAGF